MAQKWFNCITGSTADNILAESPIMKLTDVACNKAVHNSILKGVSSPTISFFFVLFWSVKYTMGSVSYTCWIKKEMLAFVELVQSL